MTNDLERNEELTEEQKL